VRIALLVVLGLVALPRDTRADRRDVVEEAGATATDASDPQRAALFDPQSLWRAAATVTHHIQQPPRPPTRDALTNGVLIGAIAGAALLGSVGGVICKVQQEEGGPSCVPDVIRLAAIGAGVGAGAGLAIDAALTRHPGLAAGIRIRF
jgi:hypothetical protein